LRIYLRDNEKKKKKRKQANWTGQILHWNYLLKYVIEGKLEESV
jgi:hypothetical protein